MEEKYVLALDVGTTGLRAILFDHDLKQVANAYREIPLIIPHPGWVEQDPQMYWEKTQEVIQEVRDAMPVESITALGITNQRAAFTVWDALTGRPLTNIIGWQDVRTADECATLTRSFGYRAIRGLMRFLYLFDKKPFFYAASKIAVTPIHATIRTKWVLDHVPEVTRAKAKKREILWGALDTWLIWNLTEGRVHATDISNFSSTGFLNPFTLKANTTYTKPMKIPLEWLPEVKPTNGNYGETTLFGGTIPIRAAVGDQQASLFGQGCFLKGDTKVTNGTGSFVNMNTGSQPAVSPHGLIPLVAWQLDGENGTPIFMLEAEASTCGDLIDWLVDSLGIITSPTELDELAESVPSTNDVYLVPAFTGLRFPYWDSQARGAIVGLTRDTKKAHLMRAVLEGIGFPIQDIISVLSADTKIPITEIKTDGGVSRSDYINQFIANMTGARVVRGPSTDMTAVGAATLAGLAVGFWQDLEEIKQSGKGTHIFQPQISPTDRAEKQFRWENAVTRARGWAVEMPSRRVPKN